MAVMLWPRETRINADSLPDRRPEPTYISEELHEKIRAALKDHVGLQSLGKAGWWWLGYPGAPASHKVLRIVECRPRQVTLEFPSVTADRLSSLPPARRGIVIKPHGTPPRDSTAKLTLADIRRRKAMAPGSLAASPDASAALRLVVSVVRTIYSN